MAASPTVPPPEQKKLNRLLSRNIQELQERRADERRAAGRDAGLMRKRRAGRRSGVSGERGDTPPKVAILGWAMGDV